MSLDLLGEGFDLHGGGQDLQFPHHENERAQAQALGKRFAAHWMHNGFVEVGGEKMSKSLGKFTSLTDLLSSTDARAYRLLVLQSHYRSPIEVTRVTAEHASRSLVRLDDLARRASDIPADTPDEAVMSSFRQRMEDDLDTPGAVALVFDAVRDANSAIDDGNVGKAGALVAAIREIARVTGLELRSEIAQIDPQTADLIAARDAARRSRDFIEADAIRDKLAALGWVVEDGADGTKVHR